MVTTEHQQLHSEIEVCVSVRACVHIYSIQWDLLMWTLDNKDTCIIHTLSYGPKCSLSYKLTWKMRTLMIGPKASVIHRVYTIVMIVGH